MVSTDEKEQGKQGQRILVAACTFRSIETAGTSSEAVNY